ncbi:restriction endonuclease subunit S [Nitrosococcus oceani]|uniref:restriction endonuclease subunit S n=1 Tax=Nitrosococcus oceani TaxID=1229 RepID=UPI0004E8C1BC|nr:restriction endonuclease subunit S [Nitrosococcus oceani]KFI21552.1 restriction endonuclease [Nitrosococcus oceani]
MSDTVPEGWEVKPLGKLVDVRSSNIDKKTETSEIPVRLCNYTDVYYNNRITSAIDFMAASAKQREIDRFSLEKGDVIITKDSETPDDIAVPSYVSDDLSGVVCGYHLTLLKPDQDESDGEFLSHLFQLPSVQHYFYILANGITRFGLTADAINEAPLLTPPLPEQQKIAAILSSVDDVIEKTRAQIHKLKDLKTAMMQELLTKGIGHTKFKDSPVGRIPVGWGVKEFNRIFDFKNGVNKGKESFGHGVPIISYRNVYDGGGIYDSNIKSLVEMNEAELPRFSCLYGDVFFTRTSETQDEIGYANVYLGGRNDVVYSGFVIRARQADRVLHPKYCKYAFQSHSIREQMLHNSKYTTRAGISSEGLSCIKICVPPIDEQVKIANFIGSIDGRISCQSQRLKSVCLIKKALMQDLLTGKVRVNVEQEEAVVA